ncbi:MAG: hypothetical protein QXV87_01250 [Candidatus Bathyarchaeia archaeon]
MFEMTEVVEKGLKKIGITVSKPVLAILCIIFGLIVIIWKEFLNLVVGVFLIIEGVLLLTEYLELQRQQPKQSPQS